jgi:hypothetical protein
VIVRVYRVQDARGRGPWVPGFSHEWLEADAPAGRMTETLMDLLPIDQLRALSPEYHYGCACRSLPALLAWFTPAECHRLARLGYHPVSLTIDAVVAESASQLLLARRRPLAEGATRHGWPRTLRHPSNTRRLDGLNRLRRFTS